MRWLLVGLLLLGSCQDPAWAGGPPQQAQVVVEEEEGRSPWLDPALVGAYAGLLSAGAGLLAVFIRRRWRQGGS